MGLFSKFATSKFGAGHNRNMETASSCGHSRFEMSDASVEAPRGLVPDSPLPTEEALVSVVVPTYQEAKNLPLLVQRITAALKTKPHEIIIVDDNSNDGTDEAVANLRKEGHAVRLIVRTDQ